MIGDLTNHLWQSTIFVVAAGLLAVALRQNRAAVRHWVWLTASLKFVVPFALLMGLGQQFAWAPAVQQTTPPPLPAVSIAIDQIAQPFSDVFPTTAWAPQASGDWTLPILAGVWVCGFTAIALTRWRAWRRIRAAVRASTPLTIRSLAGADLEARIQIRSAPGLLGPGVVGVWRPVLLVPAGIVDHLTPPQLASVFAHELCHVQRRDNLTAAVHMLVEAIFWFHPLVWWIGARLVDERERACDEYVLRVCGEPEEYAEGILNVCKFYVESPLACVPGVSGSNLKKRIEAIMINRIGLELTSARKTVLAVAAAGALAVPFVIGMVTAPLRASSVSTQTTTPEVQQKFEVASIKPCEPQPVPPGGRSGGGNGSFSPGRAYLSCFVVRNLIDVAYAGNRGLRDVSDPINNWPMRLGGNTPGEPQRIRGGPAWVYSDRYTIEAKAAALDPTEQASPARAAMMGPMLRALLEDRFQLKVHQEVEEVPMWALTVAKGGLKIKPMPEGGCTKDRSNGPIVLSDAARRGVLPTCGTVNGGPNGSNWRYEHGGQTLAVIATVLSADLGVTVLDRTGVTDIFNISWEYGPDENTPGSVRWFATYGPESATRPTAASVFTALQEQLGLTLEKIRGPRAFIVIDRIERPSPDRPSAIFAPPARAQGAGPRAPRATDQQLRQSDRRRQALGLR